MNPEENVSNSPTTTEAANWKLKNNIIPEGLHARRRLFETACEYSNTPPEFARFENLRISSHEDFLNQLEESFLLRIFKHFLRKHRADIHNIMTVCQRLHRVSSDPTLDTIKWEGGVTIISRTEKGYGFEHHVKCENYSWKKETTHKYKYEIFEIEGGGYEEEKEINGHLDNFPHMSAPTHRQIPENLYTALEEILRRHEATFIPINKIPFDSHLFSRLLCELKNHKIQLLTFRPSETVYSHIVHLNSLLAAGMIIHVNWVLKEE